MSKLFTMRLPATSANLGPGFDALGLAMDLALEVTASESPRASTRSKPRAATATV